MLFQETRLWQSAFQEDSLDPFTVHRQRLKTQLLIMRERVSQLLTHIPVDCRDLTVHDITHLDALWDSAETIHGRDWSLNPAETFVFGAAILVHDAGLTTLAYKDGLAGLKATDLWADLAAPYLNPRNSVIGNKQVELDPEVESSILFEALRTLHAEQATKLCRQSWQSPNGDAQYLIEDSELRETFGESIGRIASSHHWTADRITSELSTHFGGSPLLPGAWTINECKIACLLRCADAAQVDRTRAPTLMYAALRPSRVSALHWNSQYKLNRPTLKADAIYLASSSSFPDLEADSWWIAYDLASILDKELRSSNAILTEIGESSFAAQRVAGAESPEAFAKYVKTKAWRPIDASVRVTDPLQLARTLGGKYLYGTSPEVPFREVIQNAADAIRARRALEDRGIDFGHIAVTVEQHPSKSESCLVHIDDDGIGMSERILSTTLVDFGKSFWTSSILREEFPGLKSKSFQHIGKFGIGFFSVFEISQEVTVISKRYDSGIADTRALEFRGLVSRPLLRAARKAELPVDTSTRVTLIVDKQIVQGMESPQRYNINESRDYLNRIEWFSFMGPILEKIRGMVSFLNIRVSFEDRRNGQRFQHSSKIYDKESDELISELPFSPSAKKAQFFSLSTSIKAIKDSLGDGYGRAALDIDSIISKSHTSRGLVSVGGIVTGNQAALRVSENHLAIPYFGVVEGRTERASRDTSILIAPPDAVKEWLSDQLRSMDQSILRKSEIMEISSFALAAMGSDSGLAFAFHRGETKTVGQISEIANRVCRFLVPVSWRFEAWPELIGYDVLRPEYFEALLSEEFVVLATGSDRIAAEDDARVIRRDGGGPLSREKLLSAWKGGRAFVGLVEKLWSGQVTFKLIQCKIFSTNISSLSSDRWVLCIDRPGGMH